MKPNLGAAACLSLVFFGCALAPEQQAFLRNGNAIFSEEEDVAQLLGSSLADFLLDLRNGESPPARLIPGHQERFAFWYASLVRAAGSKSTKQASLLKCYPIEEGSYLLTLAFQEQERIDMILEVQAFPTDKGFRFGCPFFHRTADLAVAQIGEVRFHYSSALDFTKASSFVEFKNVFAQQLGVDPEPLHYYCLSTLEDLLRSYGVVYDARKCNWLAEDLGFLDANGFHFMTGTGNPDFRFAYVEESLPLQPDFGDEIYPPFAMGIAAYYGGYGLSGDSMEVLKAQFREALSKNPEMNFLEEFQKERKSSIQRHFTYFVICAFLFEEALNTQGFDAAMGLARSGRDGERFYANLEQTLGVPVQDFHALVVRLIQA